MPRFLNEFCTVEVVDAVPAVDGGVEIDAVADVVLAVVDACCFWWLCCCCWWLC